MVVFYLCLRLRRDGILFVLYIPSAGMLDFGISLELLDSRFVERLGSQMHNRGRHIKADAQHSGAGGPF